MKNTQTTKVSAFYVLALILGLILGLFIAPGTIHGQTGSACISITRSLNVGSRDNSSKDVTTLQNFLYAKGYLSVQGTGYFGGLTLNAVKAFQTKEGLPAVGNVGPMTRAKVNAVSCVTAPAPTIPVEPTIPAPVVPTTPVSNNKTLPYEVKSFSDFEKKWGNLTITEDKTLEIKATESTNGAQITLPDTGEWTNYKVKAGIFVKQSTVTLLARYIDDNNFLGCTFSGKYVEIIQRVNGESRVVGSATVEYFPSSSFFYHDLNISMRVDGKSVGCTLIGSEDNVTFTNVDSSLLKGGVGIQTWVNAVNVANVQLRSYKVETL